MVIGLPETQLLEIKQIVIIYCCENVDVHFMQNVVTLQVDKPTICKNNVFKAHTHNIIPTCLNG